jgi:hydrogenase expression/formation protein HypE
MSKMRLDCPLPKLDFDVITLGHGSGGLLTNKLLDAGVFSLFSNEYLDQKHDGVILNLTGEIAFTTDSFVVSPITFPGGDIGDLAINGTVNDLAMCGAIPKFISVGFILEEGLKIEEFWEILISMKSAAQVAGVQIVTGDTKVVEKGKGDKIFINTTGLGIKHERASIGISNIKPRDKIILSGQPAHHGMAIMSVREGLEFESTITSDTTPLNKPIINLVEHFGNDVHLLRDPTRGGVATVLAEIARQSGLGIDISSEKIILDPQVEGACEIMGLDPLYVANEGLFVAFISEKKAVDVLAQLHKIPGFQHASIIGAVSDEHPGKALIESEIGGKRVLNMLPGEQLPRIC